MVVWVVILASRKAEDRRLVQLTKVVHNRKDDFDVYIGRPSKWGNPFSHLPGAGEFLVRDRTEAIYKYREWIKTQPQLLADLGELRGKTLGCWCKPKPCHGDVLAELADGERGLFS